MRPRAVTPFLVLMLVGLSSAALGGSREAARRVREGMAHFRAGDYEKAAEAFAEADVALPEDAWIGFDRACVDAAQGDTEKAGEGFEQAALSRDAGLAVRSRYNLGTIAAEKARALFGEKPEEAPAEVRGEGLGLLIEAVGHFRECLQLDPAHADARHNLEVIRLWIKHMQEVWRQRDREKQREEMDLLEFLQMIEAQQRALRTATRALGGQSDSPQRRQALVSTESSQRELAEEIEPLKEKIEAELGGGGQGTPSAAQAGGPQAAMGPSPEDRDKALEALENLANDARAAMFTAADELHGSSVADAAGSQAEAVEKLNEIYTAVVPFPTLVQRAIGVEQGLVDQVAPVVENPEDEQALDLSETAWEQRFVAGWAEALVPKAEQGLKGLEGVDPSAMAAAPGDGSQAGAPDPEAVKKIEEEMEGLKRSMEKAIELGPKVQELTDQSATHLAEEKPAEALPKQEEALRLLKEIADPLPKQDQQQQGDQDKDQEQDDQKKQDQGQSGEQEQQERRRQNPSQRQAEEVLKKVRDRQRDRRDLEKQLRQHIYRPGTVEKDW